VLKPDLFITEQKVPPAQNRCRSGHNAPKLFKRESGPDDLEEPTRFFQVSSDQDPSVNGVYCEICLIVANAVKAGTLKINVT